MSTIEERVETLNVLPMIVNDFGTMVEELEDVTNEELKGWRKKTKSMATEELREVTSDMLDIIKGPVEDSTFGEIDAVENSLAKAISEQLETAKDGPKVSVEDALEYVTLKN